MWKVSESLQLFAKNFTVQWLQFWKHECFGRSEKTADFLQMEDSYCNLVPHIICLHEMISDMIEF